MKITCQRAPLSTAFANVASVVPSRPVKPIVANVKLISHAGGLTLVATDTEVSIRHLIPGDRVQIHEPGEVLLGKNKVGDILREAVGEDVRIDRDGQRVEITADRAVYKLATEDPVEFPTVGEFNARAYHILTARVLKEALRRTLFASDVGSTRYALGGVCMDSHGDVVCFVATDTRRLAIVETIAAHYDKPALLRNAVIHNKAAQLLLKCLPDDDTPVWIHVETNTAMFQFEHTTIHTRLVEGRYPKYQDVVPKSSTHEIDLVAAMFLQAIRQSLIVTSEESRGVGFEFRDGTLTLDSESPELGKSKIELPIGFDGNIAITFDPRYIADFLKVLPGGTGVRVGLTNADNAAKFTTDDGYTYVVMPLSRDK